MRRGIGLATAALAMAIAAAAWSAREEWNRTLIVLNDGAVVVAERVWEVGGDVYYENEKEAGFIPVAEIRSVEKQDFTASLLAAARRHGAAASGFFHRLAPAGARSWEDTPFAPTLAVGFAASALALFLFSRLRKATPQRRTPTEEAPSPRPSSPPVEGEMPGRADVIRFFLQLFRRQIGAPPTAPADFQQLQVAPNGIHRIYELRVRLGDDWVRRRMTIGPIGEEGGSKSTCHFVIFDRHLVVKIPPRPIRSFDDYVAGLKKERHIVERLAPRECIVPQVAVILGMVHKIASCLEAPEEVREDTYIQWLRKNPEHQEALKIGGRFAYFMDLSRYYFLSQIMEDLHEIGSLLQAEIATLPEWVRQPEKFRERYGAEHEALGFEMREFFLRCEAELRDLVKRRGLPAAAAAYRIQGWIVEYLLRQDVADMENTPAGVREAVLACLAGRFAENRGVLEAYQALIRGFARRLTLEQNRTAVAGIVSHLLDLLAWLNARGVAMRDLKPDNLLVAGDPANYPAFLRTPAEYTLGFIDVETAVLTRPEGEAPIRQPLLGGTPYYATPANLFPNPVLEATLRELPRALHLQDWHAVLVMVFNVVTGDLLFERTARLFAETKAQVIEALRGKEDLRSRFEEASRAFWQNAASEFRLRLRAAEPLLRMVEADLSPAARGLLRRTLKHETKLLEQRIRSLVASGNPFASSPVAGQLLSCPSARIAVLKKELEARASGGPPSSSFKERAAFLERLCALKALCERKAALRARLEAEGHLRLSAWEILIVLFNSVWLGLHREEWAASGEEAPPSESGDELSLATTL